MRAPLSWIREYVDLPDDVTPADLAHRLTALGLKLEALESPRLRPRRPARRRPRAVGGAGAAEERQDDQLVPGRLRPRATASTGSSAGRTTSRPATSWSSRCPARRLPGGFEIAARKTYGHVSDGMICSTKELGTGEDHGGILVLDPRIDGDVAPGDDAIGLLGLRDDVIEFEINPDRAYALSLRGIAREAAIAYGVPFHDPAERDVAGAERRRLPGAPRRARRVPGLRDPHGHRLRPGRAHPAAHRPADPARRDAADLPGRRRHQLRDARARPAAARLRRRQAGRPDRRTPGHGGREDHHARRRPPQPVGRGPADHRRQRPDRHRRRDGRPDHRAVGDHVDVVIEAAHFEPTTIFRSARRHKLPSEASKRFERGVDPLLPAYAADRVAQLLVEHGGGTVDRRRDVRRHAARAAADHRRRSTCRRGSPAWRSTPDTTVRTCARSAARSPPTATTLTALPPTWRPDVTDPYDLVEEVARIVGYTEVPSVLPVRAVRPRADPVAEAAPPGRLRAGRRRPGRGEELAVRRARRLRPARAPRGRRAARHRPDGQPAVRAEAGAHHDAAPGAARHRGPQRRPGPVRRRDLRDRAGVRPDAGAAEGADPRRRLAPRRRRPRQAAGRRARASR